MLYRYQAQVLKLTLLLAAATDLSGSFSAYQERLDFGRLVNVLSRRTLAPSITLTISALAIAEPRADLGPPATIHVSPKCKVIAMENSRTPQAAAAPGQRTRRDRIRRVLRPPPPRQRAFERGPQPAEDTQAPARDWHARFD